jgi:dihydrofolate reductase
MKAILACEHNGGIGLNGSMPWPSSTKDLQRFKELTLYSTVAMGRGTWESTGMPKPLPNRRNIVISSSTMDLPEEVVQLKDINDITEWDIDWCIGGASLFTSLLDQINEIHLSHLHKTYECDTHIDLSLIEKQFERTVSILCLDHKYEIWKRK